MAKPSKGTPADRRLTSNKRVVAAAKAGRASARKQGKTVRAKRSR